MLFICKTSILSLFLVGSVFNLRTTDSQVCGSCSHGCPHDFPRPCKYERAPGRNCLTLFLSLFPSLNTSGTLPHSTSLFKRSIQFLLTYPWPDFSPLCILVCFAYLALNHILYKSSNLLHYYLTFHTGFFIKSIRPNVKILGNWFTTDCIPSS